MKRKEKKKTNRNQEIVSLKYFTVECGESELSPNLPGIHMLLHQSDEPRTGWEGKVGEKAT